MVNSRLRPLTKFYLAVYNFTVFLFHLFALIDISKELSKGTFNYSNHYDFMIISTFLQFGDVLNSWLGLTSTNISSALTQIIGRLLVLYIARQSDVVWTAPVSLILLYCYTIIEVFRYSYYFNKTINIDIFTISWLRYNIWLVLYPIGLLSEAVIFANVIQRLHERKQWIIRRPFGLDFNVDLAIVVGSIIVVAFPAIARRLLCHMWHQRKIQSKKLSKKTY